jgi:hypothetical protein
VDNLRELRLKRFDELVIRRQGAVSCADYLSRDEKQQVELLERFSAEGLECKALVS